MSYDEAWKRTGPKEGGYSNNPADRGGPTKWGVTERVARANGYEGDMRLLGEDFAKAIGKTQYWDVLNLDAVDKLSPRIAAEMFDTLYNGGEPGQWLQRCLNVFNRGATLYPDMKVDGRIGPMTIQALKMFLGNRGTEGERVMLVALNSLQAVRFIGISENNPSQEAFTFGWLLNRVEI